MPLTCNIDAKGRIARLMYGVATIVAGLWVAVGWAWGSEDWLTWVVAATLLALGALGIFSARAGWCAVRAMGWKTPV